MVLPVVICKVNLDKGYIFNYNYNGLMPHFITNYKDTLCVISEELQQLHNNNRFGLHLASVIEKGLFKSYYTFLSIKERFL